MLRPLTSLQPPVADAATTLTIASAGDREQIYQIRHRVYASELRQHPENAGALLMDSLDSVNTYIVARRGARVLGFVAITPPSPAGYSIDKYFARADVPVVFDDGLYEARLLTVVPEARRSQLAALLMYAAFRYCEARGAHTVVAIGRLELLPVYERVGLARCGKRVTSGAVTYELLVARLPDLHRIVAAFEPVVRRIGRDIRWEIPGLEENGVAHCVHGGTFFDAIGDEFDNLRRASAVIGADVLDAWFPPAPAVVATVAANLEFALRTSPPTHSEGLRRVIARARRVGIANILPGTGSSELIFTALRTWVTPESRVLVLDPMYGEYVHVLETVIGAKVDRLRLRREQHYDLDEGRLAEALAQGYDWVVLVNPNSPTGRYMPGSALIEVLQAAPSSTRVWVDETYVDFAGGESIERFAAGSENVVVSKSMSKAYALSGARVGYLCGPEAMIAGLRAVTPPWSVSLPAQIAACEALRAVSYYQARWCETAELREALADALRKLGWDVVPGAANFLLCHLPEAGPDATTVAAEARRYDLFLREFVAGEGLGARDLRIGVKDAETNRRVVNILQTVLDALSSGTRSEPSTVESA